MVVFRKRFSRAAVALCGSAVGLAMAVGHGGRESRAAAGDDAPTARAGSGAPAASAVGSTGSTAAPSTSTDGSTGSTAAPSAGDGASSARVSGQGQSAPPARSLATMRRTPLRRSYVEACARGNTRYASHDFAAAIAIYRAAIEGDVDEPLGYYLLGEAELAAGNLADAEASWRRAAAESDGDPSMHARALFVLADLMEREKRWDAAKAAWQAYLDAIPQPPAAGSFAGSARSRLEALERMTRQDRAYDTVRRRIRETSDGGVFSSVSGGPATP